MEVNDTIKVLFLTLKICQYSVIIHHEVEIIYPSKNKKHAILSMKSFAIVNTENKRNTKLIKRNTKLIKRNGRKYTRKYIYKRLKSDVLKRNNFI